LLHTQECGVWFSSGNFACLYLFLILVVCFIWKLPWSVRSRSLRAIANAISRSEIRRVKCDVRCAGERRMSYISDHIACCLGSLTLP
jgi:hypothetical protein